MIVVAILPAASGVVNNSANQRTHTLIGEAYRSPTGTSSFSEPTMIVIEEIQVAIGM